MQPPVFDLRYASWATLERDCTQQIAMNGLLLRTTDSLPQFSPLAVHVETPAGTRHELGGEVLQVVPGQGIAVRFAPEAAHGIKALIEESSIHRGESPDGPPSGDDPLCVGPGSRGALANKATEPRLLQDQIKEMTVAEKRQAAMHGRRDMRLLLIRDRNKTIHPFIIKNPAITLDEIEQIAKMPSVNPDVLRLIVRNRDWTRSASICRNLVRNPKTPMKEALSLLLKLPMSDIRAIAKSGNVRTPIVQAARKKVNQ